MAPESRINAHKRVYARSCKNINFMKIYQLGMCPTDTFYLHFDFVFFLDSWLMGGCFAFVCIRAHCCWGDDAMMPCLPEVPLVSM